MLTRQFFFLPAIAEKWSVSCCFQKQLLKYQKFCTWHTHWVAWLTASLLDGCKKVFLKRIHESNQKHQLNGCRYNKKIEYKLHKTCPCWVTNPPEKQLSQFKHMKTKRKRNSYYKFNIFMLERYQRYLIFV